MNLDRRDFVKTALTASASLAALGSVPALAAGNATQAVTTRQEYYELRAYRLKPDGSRTLLDGYLENALIPVLNKRGIKNVGVFTEPESKDGPALWVLMAHPSIESVATVTSELNLDPGMQAAGAEYLNSADPKNPPFDRVDSWLLLAFAGLPQLVVPAVAQERKPRIYELRTYESFSELKALKKVDMFNAGEITVMQDVDLAPVFYGQALVGQGLPHLTYMLSSPDRATLAKSWAAFGKHPAWMKMKVDPQYADTVSKITSRIFVPTKYSQL